MLPQTHTFPSLHSQTVATHSHLLTCLAKRQLHEESDHSEEHRFLNSHTDLKYLAFENAIEGVKEDLMAYFKKISSGDTRVDAT